MVVLFYLPVLSNDFIVWDDREMITGNPHIQSLGLSSLGWMLTVNSIGLWVPATFFTLALDYGIGGLDPRFYHLTNVLFHVFNTLLVFLLSRKTLELAGRLPENRACAVSKDFVLSTALLTALLFGLHPIRVESVAWAGERKDVLYGFFYLLGLWAYLDFAAKGKSAKGENTPLGGVSARKFKFFKVIHPHGTLSVGTDV